MALVACGECNAEISDKAPACPKCGAPTGMAKTDPMPIAPHVQLVKSAKSRGVYIILGLFFGLLGIHNFYAGRYGTGVVQLLTVLILGWFVVGIVVVGIWVIVELFVVTKDGAGDAFA